MFVEHKEAVEITEQPAKVLKLSEAIVIGCPYITENKIFSGCALAAGYYARTGRRLEEDGRADMGYIGRVSEVFGIPEDVLAEASNRHTRGASREKVATWLGSKGY